MTWEPREWEGVGQQNKGVGLEWVAMCPPQQKILYETLPMSFYVAH